MLGEFLATDVESIESIGAVGAVLEQVLLGLCEFLLQSSCSELKVLRLCPAVIAKRFRSAAEKEPVATARDSGGLYCENEVVVVLAIEKRHESLLAGEGLVDEKVLLVLSHGVAKVNTFDLPAVPFKLVDYPPTKILLVDGIV